MKILVIGLHFAEYSVSLARALAKSSDVLLVLSEPNYRAEVGQGTAAAEAPGRLRIVTLPHRKSLGVLLSNVFRLRKLTMDFAPDVVHCQEEPKDYWAFALPWLSRYPTVLTIHDPKPHSGVDSKKTVYSRRALYLRAGRKLADAVIVHGELLKRDTLEVCPWLAGRVFVLPHGPLGVIFNRPRGRSQPGEMLFFGRAEEYKGLRYFVEAVRLLRARGRAVQGVIAGRGSDLDAMKDGLLRDGAFRIIDKYLQPEEVLERFFAAQVIVLPYVDGTQSGVAAYALGCGRAVVATNVGSLPELIRDGQTGLIVPPRNAEALADAMEKLVLDPALAERLGDQALALAHGELSWDRIAQSSREVYDCAIGRRGRKN